MSRHEAVPSARSLWEAMSHEADGALSENLDEGVSGLVQRLYLSNRQQWDAENAARDAPSDRQLAAAKRVIDVHNSRRTMLIDAVNEMFARKLRSVETVPPLTCQPGMTCDRLSVLKIRLQVARRDSSRTGVVRTQAIEETVNGLLVAFDTDLGDVTAGRRSLSANGTHKIYGRR